MKRHIIIASHNRLAEGMKKTLEFIAGEQENLVILTAYTDDRPIEKQVSEIMNRIPDDDEIIVFTDMLAGSVNQKFFPYRSRAHTQIVTGMNLPIVLAVTMETADDYISDVRMRDMVQEARNQLLYVNDIDISADDDDE